MSSAEISDEGRGSIEIEVSSPHDIAERALSRQSSALSSSLAKANLSRTVSCPARDSAADSSLDTFRSALREAQGPWFNGHALGALQDNGPTSSGDDADPTLETLSPSSQSQSLKVPAPKIRRRKFLEKSELAASLDNDEDADDDDGFIPPHIMSLPKGYGNSSNADLRSHPGSLFEGVGRKLRGMDAVRFRRDVMRRTGFLETTAEHPVC